MNVELAIYAALVIGFAAGFVACAVLTMSRRSQREKDGRHD